MSAGEAAAELSELPDESVRDRLAGLDPGFTGQVLLELPAGRAANVIAATDGLTAGRVLDAIASRPRAAADVVALLPVTCAARAVPHMTRARAATLMAALPAGQAAWVLGKTDQRVVADILTTLPSAAASRQLEAMSMQRACAVLNHVPPITTATLLRDCADGRTDRLLRGLSDPVRTQVSRHLATGR